MRVLGESRECSKISLEVHLLRLRHGHPPIREAMGKILPKIFLSVIEQAHPTPQVK